MKKIIFLVIAICLLLASCSQEMSEVEKAERAQEAAEEALRQAERDYEEAQRNLDEFNQQMDNIRRLEEELGIN